ncbi:MAG: hypothetical protein WBH20_14880 [Oceanisphaera sp.]|uniref:hypothetical protein n=1 Tax=Oceanisphaera sp. TaxID=1929979 RepID=UPI003C7154C9
MDDWISVVISCTGLLIVFIGWNVIYRNAKRIATRAETKSILDDIIKHINDIESNATNYWLSGRRERVDHENYELLLMAKRNVLASRIELLTIRNITVCDKSHDNLSNMFEYALLDCEAADQTSADKRREIAQNILNASTELVMSLYNNFAVHYRPQAEAKSIWRIIKGSF